MDDKQNDGKKIEKAADKAFKALMTEGKCVVVRLHDTKSSTFYLPPSPGDFMGTAMGKPLLVECKSSDVRHTFAECNIKEYVKPTQFGYTSLWIKQKSTSLFIFHSVITNECEFWRGEDVLKSYSTGKHLDPKKILARCPIAPKLLHSTLEAVLEQL